MKFGKAILTEQVPGWSRYYLDYKLLKKIISSLAAHRPATEAAALATGVQPRDLLRSQPLARELQEQPLSPTDGPPILASLGQDDERGAGFQAHKAAFFFKLERELEKINAFYLEKEAELKLRLETLLSKRRAAAMHVLPDTLDDNAAKDHVEWSAVEEGFRLLERDLGKLQQFVEINATGFRKILKKWDKRSKSSTKELYLARQVEVQPVFNRQLIAELSDTVATCLLDLTDLSVGLKYEAAAEDATLSQRLSVENWAQMGPFHELESNLRKAVATSDVGSLRDLVRFAGALSQSSEARMHITRILWKTVIDAPPDLADLILASASDSFDYGFVDDINGRTCLHEVAIVGVLRLVDLCLDNGVPSRKADIYGRSALHYAAMYGHTQVCRRLIEVGLPPNEVDLDNCTPLIYATLRGSVGCVRVLLEEGKVSVQNSSTNGDLMPLGLAARSGHQDVVILLLQYGAPSLPNTNGEYPIHLAAQEGHADVCRLLTKYEGWDTPDKYNEWTPLFHAARYGHSDFIRSLLDAGCRVDRTDEMGNSAAYYAAWFGHRDCTSLLMDVTARPIAVGQSSSHPSPMSDTQMSTGTDSDIDAIPSLSLPPPMMPYRVYGHNYLDKNSLVQVSIGHMSSRFGDLLTDPSSSVQLRPPLGGSGISGRYLHTSPRLKLVMTPTSVVTAAPYSIPIPNTGERTVFAFQVPGVDELSLEFSLYPNFGTKTIGRAVAPPPFFKGAWNSHALTIPILDHRLHIIGEVSFEVNVVTPFSGVTLEIGGSVETYWKSITNPVSPPLLQGSTPRAVHSPRGFGSAQHSPSTAPAMHIGSHSLTHSSVTGNYLYVTVQVTRDLEPVIFPGWSLPEDGYDLGVADVTLAQFKALARRHERSLPTAGASSSVHEFRSNLSQSMASLREVLQLVPPTLGVCLEIAYPTSSIRQRCSLRHVLDLNVMVDAVLRTIYDKTTQEGHSGRRNVVFTSFSPDVCSALNWKQPNYPVFFASQCGQAIANLPSGTTLCVEDVRDYRLSSLSAAVEWAKMNNLLGVLLDGELLYQVPSVIQGVKDFGLLVGAIGNIRHLQTGQDTANGVDAFLQDGILTYLDHSAKRS